MAFPTVTVSGLYENPDGTPAAGTVTFRPSTRLVDSVDDVVVADSPIEVALDAAGAFTVTLAATSGGDLTPEGVLYQVRVAVTGASVQRFSVALPGSSPVVDMADLVPVSSTPAVWLEAATADDLAAHAADTSAVHGIADTSALLDTSDIGTTIQPVDADLTAIAALATAAFGRSVLEAANAAGLRTLADTYSTGQVDSSLAAKAPLASPALTGTPTAPTPTAGDSSTKVATTEFVGTAVDNATSGVLAGLLSARPAASADNQKDLYFATDVNGGTLYRSNGSSWVQVARGVNEPFVDLHVVKSADETVNNSTVLQNDDELFVTVEANAVYWLDALIFYSTSAVADLKFGWSNPGGASSMKWQQGAMHQTGGTTGPYGDMAAFFHTIISSGNFGGGDVSLVARPAGILNVGSTGGILQAQWAQATAEVSDTKVLAKSALRLHRLS